MKRNITYAALLMATLALAACSTQKLASSNNKAEDDVYYSQVKAGDQIEQPVNYRQDVVYNQSPDDDYYYYDSYASRINRFDYYSPFNYYDDYYYGYNPYSSFYNYGWNGYAYSGYGLGFGLSYGWGSPYYYGYNPYYGLGYGGYGYGYGYTPYSYLGVGYGGGYPYWGVYSAYNSTGRGRPYRGPGVVGNNNSNMVNRSVHGIGYSGAYPNTGYYPGRPTAINGGNSRTNTTGYSGTNSQSRPRPQRTDYPNYQPETRTSTNSYPSNNGNSGGGSSGSSSSGSRGGGRPSRP